MVSPSKNEHSKFRLVYCTVPNMETAKKIATTLIEEKLAACCNIIPGVLSIYPWEKKIQSDNELLLILKSKENLFKVLEERMLKF
jgi:periplasmic divalent cation tolerance protein